MYMCKGIMKLARCANIQGREGSEALVQRTLILIAQFALATVSAKLVDCCIIVAIDASVSIAILSKLDHVVLDSVGRTVGIVHTVCEGCKKKRGEFYGSPNVAVFLHLPSSDWGLSLPRVSLPPSAQ